MSRLVTAWDTRSGKRRQVPVHWFDHDDLSANLTRTDPGIPQVAPAGVNQAPGPDSPDYATEEEIAAHAAAAGELKGKELKAALKAAGLPQTGNADEQRASLVAHQEQIEADVEAAALQAIADADKPADGQVTPPTDSTTGDTDNNTPPVGDE